MQNTTLNSNNLFWDMESFGESPALIEDSRHMTYSQLAFGADTIAQLIGSKRQLVFLLCKNCISAVVSYIGCLRGNHVPLLLGEKIHSDFLNTLITRYKPGYIICPQNTVGGDVISSFDGYEIIETGYHGIVRMSPKLALLLTTSGSTGSPKLVRQSKTNIYENAKSICQYLNLDKYQRPITTLPMNYTYGLSIINSHLLVGGCILLTDFSVMQKEFWTFFKKYDATSFGGVPYTYEILKRLGLFDMDLPSLQYMTQAGGKLSRELNKEIVEFCRKNGKRFYVMYGQTEATARMSYMPWDNAADKYGSIGIAIPGGKFFLLDSNGKKINRPNVTGELVYKGLNVTMGYAEQAVDLQKADENNGTLYTGDMAQFDEDGFYYIVGRKKRFVKIFGNRINLDEIEQLLKEKGISCACIGSDKIIKVVAEGTQGDTIKIKKLLTEMLNVSHSIFDIHQIEKLPKNDTGKILYKELEELFNV